MFSVSLHRAMTLRPGKLVLVCCWQIVFYGTLTFLAVLQAKTSLLVPDGCFSMMSTKWTALEDRDCVSVWSKGQACLLTIKRCSGSPKFGVPVCKCGCYFLSPWTFYIILWKRNKQTNKKNPKPKKQKPPLSLLAIANTMSPQVLSLTQEICVFCHHL